jgi:hypothetical protein
MSGKIFMTNSNTTVGAMSSAPRRFGFINQLKKPVIGVIPIPSLFAAACGRCKLPAGMNDKHKFDGVERDRAPSRSIPLR